MAVGAERERGAVKALVTVKGYALSPMDFVDGDERESITFAIVVEDVGFPGGLVGIADKDAGEGREHDDVNYKLLITNY